MVRDLVVVGGGPSGIFAAMFAAKSGKSVTIVEKLDRLGVKLLASGNGRANLSNTLDNDTFLEHMGHGKKSGLFLKEALNHFDNSDLTNLFSHLGVEITSFDGFHIFPKDRRSSTIVKALSDELQSLNVEILTSSHCKKIVVEDGSVKGVTHDKGFIECRSVVVATGGKGFPTLGGGDLGYTLLSDLGHKITPLYPGMVKLEIEEDWISECRADTISKAVITIDIKKYCKKSYQGDLIFTKNGIMGPLIQDFSREVTPLFEKYEKIPIKINFVKGINGEEIFNFAEEGRREDSSQTILQYFAKLMPKPLINELANQVNLDPEISMKDLKGEIREQFLKRVVSTTLHITSSQGFDHAMVTRGGVSLKEVNPRSMESKIVKNLYIVGEVLDLDGPCGGYNLQTAFSTGALAGSSIL